MIFTRNLDTFKRNLMRIYGIEEEEAEVKSNARDR